MSDQAYRAVAIVGVGAILPDAPDVPTFWRNVQQGRYSISQVSPDRWNPDDYYHPDPTMPDKTYCKIGGWVRDFKFEPLKWRMPVPPKVLEVMDDAQKWAVAASRAALLDYGYPDRPLDTERTAVILGNAMAGENHYRTALRISSPEYIRALEAVPDFRHLPPKVQKSLLHGMRSQIHARISDITEDTMPGELSNIIAGRVANMLDLGGPNFVADAACASSFAALDAAIEGLVAGHFDAVLTGGVDRNMGAVTFVKFCKIGALSPDGSRPFAKGANGFVMGEGAAVFLLKRLRDAERDEDTIYAVIRGIGAASDGKGKGITAPNPIGQERAMARAWKNAGVSPEAVGYVEAHGTSTKVGDVVEAESMGRVFAEFGLPPRSIPFGSVKSNIGHLKGAAGAASLLKTALALHDKVLPPSIHFTEPNPGIDFDRLPFYVNTRLQPWDVNGHGVRSAGISSFGFGGTNFHVVVQEHVPGMLTSTSRTFAIDGLGGGSGGMPNKAPYRGVLVLGASNTSSLQARLQIALDDARAGKVPPFEPPATDDLAAEHRLAIDFEDAEQLTKRAEKAVRALETDIAPVWKPLASQGIYRGQGGKPGKVAFLFPGQGSQYVNMMRELYDLDDIVRATFDEADQVMTPLLDRPLTEYLFVDSDDKDVLDQAEKKLQDTTITQPAVLTVEVALARLLESYGIIPDLVIGHSLGEYGALVAAGVLPFGQALQIVSARGREMAKVSVEDNGCMAAVFAPLDEINRILPTLEGYVVLANINSTNQAVIGGGTAAIDHAIKVFNQLDYRAVKIPVSHAFHTRIVAPASEPLKRVISRMVVRTPRIPIVANVTGELYPADRTDIIDLLGQQVASPVQFVKGIQTLYREGARILVEVGPKRVLNALVDDILKDREDVTTLYTNHPRKGTLPSLNEALCGLYAAGLGNARTGRVPPADPDRRNDAVPTTPAPPSESTPTPDLPAPAETQVPTVAAEPQASTEPQAHTLSTGQTTVQSSTHNDNRVPTPGGSADRYLALGQLFASFLEQGRRIYDGTPPGAPAGPSFAAPTAGGRLPITGSVVVSGAALGLPGQESRVFDDGNLDRILRGEQFIDLIPYRFRFKMANKRIRRLVKHEAGAIFETITDPAETIKLAGRRGAFDLAGDFGVPESRVESLDIATQLAIAAGIEALRDAGVPLVMRYRTTSRNTYLPDRWMLPPSLADETGVIFCSAFPGLDRMSDELSRFGEFQSLNEQIKTLSQLRALVPPGQAGLASEVDRRIVEAEDQLARLNYSFDRKFIFRVLAMGHSQFAEYIGARGPNTHVNAACATTTHAMSIAEDWIRTGRCRRVIIIAGDDVTSESLMEWIGSGLLATGATTTEERLERAALPFDRRRNGLIMGMGAAAIVLETQDAVQERGMRGICELLASHIANSAYHGTRLDVDHICSVMENLVGQAEERFGIERRAIAPQTVFVSHETYTPARGGSASAEIQALRNTFGDVANQVVIANTKGYTGHAMGVGIEDVLAIKSLETGLVPPVANIHNDFEPDPELGDLNLSRGGQYNAQYALRLGAGFGSQIAMTLMRRIPGAGERIEQPDTYNQWLSSMAGYEQPELVVEQRTLHIRDVGPPAFEPAASTWQYGQLPTAWAPRPEGLPVAALRPSPAPARVPPAPPARPMPTAQPMPAAPTLPPEPAPAPTPAVASQPITPTPLPVSVAAPAVVEEQPGQDPVITRVLTVVSEKTGYPPDMLDPDLDIEADLGIDTVKQAEVFAAIREAYDIPRRDDLKLRDYNTLTKVVAFVHESRPDLASGAPAPAPAAATAVSSAPVAVETEGGQDPVIAQVLAVVSEKTGYPPDMLDLELDIEADLGIDTVKQAEVFAAIREVYDIPRRDDLKLRDYNTLTKVVAFVHESHPDLAAAGPAVSAPAAAAPTATAPASPPLAGGIEGGDPVVAKVLAVVSEKTGYPPDMLDLELDIEADLGIDTVKQAEVFAAIREVYDIPRRDDLKLRDYNTLTRVVAFVHESRPDLASGGASVPATQKVEPTEPASSSPQQVEETEPQRALDPAAGLEAAQAIPRRMPEPILRPVLDLCKPTGVEFADKRIVIVSDRGKVAKYLGYRLRPRKSKTLVLQDATPETVETQVAEWLADGPIDGVFFLPALDVEPALGEMDLARWRSEQERRVKSLYMLMRRLPNDAFLISATRMGGLHGYSPEGASAPLGGAVTGFTKAYARERPDALVKAIDFSVHADERQIAERLVDEALLDPGAVEIGYHNEQRFGIRLVERPLGDERPPFPIGRETVFVVTGAAGGITATIVADLAQASCGTFYLTDITPTPDRDNPDLARLGADDKFLKRDIAKRMMDTGTRPTPVMVDKEIAALERAACIVNAMRAIERAGGTAHYRVCNVLDADAVQALADEVQQAHGYLDVIVHAAGMERSHFLPDKPPQEFNLIYDVKVDGLFNLLKATGKLEQPLQAIVVFSSIAGRFGNAGQTDYSAANDLMCKVISSMRTTHPQTRGIATDWSAWARVGMATRRSIPEMMRRAGIDMLEPEAAAPIVRREIIYGTRGEIVVGQELGMLLDPRDPDGGLDLARASDKLKHDLAIAGKVIHLDLHRGLTFEVELDPQVEPYLHDHAMDGTPLLPGVMGVEGFAEIASLIASDLGCARPCYRVASIEDVNFYSPFKFYRQQPRTATWRAVVAPEPGGLVADVTLESTREIAATGAQQHATHFSGRVHLVPRSEEPSVAPTADPPAWNGAANGSTIVGPTDIYRVYFHGPAFQVLDGVQSEGDAVVGKLRADLPAFTGAPVHMLTVPRLLELCLQTAGVWEIGKTGVLALPTAIERVVVHRLPEDGETLYAHVKLRPGSDDALRFDGRVVDDKGTVYLDMIGYRTASLPTSIAPEQVAPLKAAVAN